MPKKIAQQIGKANNMNEYDHLMDILDDSITKWYKDNYSYEELVDILDTLTESENSLEFLESSTESRGREPYISKIIKHLKENE
jgi:hypothetical protein